MLQIATF